MQNTIYGSLRLPRNNLKSSLPLKTTGFTLNPRHFFTVKRHYFVPIVFFVFTCLVLFLFNYRSLPNFNRQRDSHIARELFSTKALTSCMLIAKNADAIETSSNFDSGLVRLKAGLYIFDSYLQSDRPKGGICENEKTHTSQLIASYQESPTVIHSLSSHKLENHQLEYREYIRWEKGAGKTWVAAISIPVLQERDALFQDMLIVPEISDVIAKVLTGDCSAFSTLVVATNGDNFATSRAEVCHYISNSDLDMDSWRVQGIPHVENSRLMHAVIAGSSENTVTNVYARLEKDSNNQWMVTTLIPTDYSIQDD